MSLYALFVADEVRTPLNVVCLELNLLQDEMEQAQMLDRANAAAGRCCVLYHHECYSSWNDGTSSRVLLG